MITVSKEWPEYILSEAPDLTARIDKEIGNSIRAQYDTGFTFGEIYTIDTHFDYVLDNGEHASLINYLHGTHRGLGVI